MAERDPIQRALELPSGARFYKCALQINPFEYLKRHNKVKSFSNEAAYNDAMVEACKAHGIEVIAVTDHYRVRTAQSLCQAAKAEGIHVFPAFEAVTKDGVHLLCFFDPDCTVEQMERFIGDCGIHEPAGDSPAGQYDARELLEKARDSWRAVCLAAHVGSRGGLLRALTAQARTDAWKSPYLLACSLPGPVTSAPQDIRFILENRDDAYRRDRPIAIVNCQDVSAPDDLARLGTWCWIKMSRVSVDGLRQAFLDPESRVRLGSDPVPEKHFELAAIAWQGGFLDGQAIRFNENLNVLIGGRGAGKSTALESIRHVLDLGPLGEEAQGVHDGIVQHVLRSGTKISLLVRSYRPGRREYRVERTIPNPPIVRDEDGQVLALLPSDILPQIEVYGQHEIAEIARQRDKLTRLIGRFVVRDPDTVSRKLELRRSLERSRLRISEARRELEQIDERLAVLPGLEETATRFREAGIEERLKEQSLLVREEHILDTAAERVRSFREPLQQLGYELPVDRAFLSSKALEGLPNKDVLSPLDVALKRLSLELQSIASRAAELLDGADNEIRAIRQRWEERRFAAQAKYEQILRELQKSSVDGEEFIQLRRRIEQLRPLGERQTVLRRNLSELEQYRRMLLVEWEESKAADFRQLERAARNISQKLSGQVRVEVEFAGNRDPLLSLLREGIGGRLSETYRVIRSAASFSLTTFVQAVRKGEDAIQSALVGIPPTQVHKLSQAPPEMIMEMEELDLPATTVVQLNVAGGARNPTWRQLSDLSTGQKATAILLLLLLESEAPLIIDQPEDDLDNRFVTEGIVPRMKVEKRRRQFILSTHNANIPVLGDAELIAGLVPSGEANLGSATIPVEQMGSIDVGPTREMVEELLEGGKEAFEMRRLKYGF